MDELTLITLAGLAAIWALVAVRLESSPVSGPMVMMVAGVVAGPDVADWIGFNLDATGVGTFLSITLALVLFFDASRVDLSVLEQRTELPSRLLGVALPLVIVFGVVAALVIFAELDLWAAAVLGVALAPTDAALGLAVVENPRVPARVRHGLTVEGGLNDGIAVPLFVLAVAGAEGEFSSWGSGVVIFVQLIGWALVIGVVVGVVGARALALACVKRWSNTEWGAVATAMFALLAYGLAQAVGGSGFVAAFVAGIAFAAKTERPARFTEGGEVVGHVMTLLAFVIFGATALGPILGDITLKIVLYAVVSLTVVRMVPTAIALIGTGFNPRTVAFIGWFGPRGLASVIFATELAEDVDFPGSELVAVVIIVVVASSVLAHGATSAPLAERYGHWIEDHGDGSLPEQKQVKAAEGRNRLRSS